MKSFVFVFFLLANVLAQIQQFQEDPTSSCLCPDVICPNNGKDACECMNRAVQDCFRTWELQRNSNCQRRNIPNCTEYTPNLQNTIIRYNFATFHTLAATTQKTENSKQISSSYRYANRSPNQFPPPWDNQPIPFFPFYTAPYSPPFSPPYSPTQSAPFGGRRTTTITLGYNPTAFPTTSSYGQPLSSSSSSSSAGWFDWLTCGYGGCSSTSATPTSLSTPNWRPPLSSQSTPNWQPPLPSQSTPRWQPPLPSQSTPIWQPPLSSQYQTSLSLGSKPSWLTCGYGNCLSNSPSSSVPYYTPLPTIPYNPVPGPSYPTQPALPPYNSNTPPWAISSSIITTSTPPPWERTSDNSWSVTTSPPPWWAPGHSSSSSSTFSIPVSPTRPPPWSPPSDQGTWSPIASPTLPGSNPGFTPVSTTTLDSSIAPTLSKPSPSIIGPSITIPGQKLVRCGPGLPKCTGNTYCDPQPLCSIGEDCPGVCLATYTRKFINGTQPWEVRRRVWQDLLDQGHFVMYRYVT